MKRAIAVGSSVLGVAAFAYALSVIGLANVQQALARVGWGFAVILLLSGLREMVKAAGWTQAFTGTDRLPVSHAFRARLAGEALSALLPMGFLVGEPMKARYVDDRMPFATAFNALLLDTPSTAHPSRSSPASRWSSSLRGRSRSSPLRRAPSCSRQ